MGRWILTSIVAATLASMNQSVAREHVTTIDWTELQQQGQLEAGEIVEQDWKEELFISNDTDELLKVRIATLEPTGISNYRYQLEGIIRYENVEQPSYLELWSNFGDKGSFFTRAMAREGPMAAMYGSYGPRDVLLPFQSDEATGLPRRLEVNLILPSKGKVWIRPLQVYEFTYEDDDFATLASLAWWSDQTGGLIGGILGSALGLLGALVGTLSGMGRGRRFAVGTCFAVIGLGVICLVVGVTAVVASQPYAVYYPLLLTGLMGTVIVGGVLPGIRKRFAQAELRRIEAMDAGTE